MKFTVFMQVCFSAVVFWKPGICAPAKGGDDFSRCQASYRNIVSNMKKSDDVTAAVGRLFFHNMDLDGNGRLASPELTLYLETKGYVHESDVMEAIKETEAWMKFAGDGSLELTTKEFMKAVDKSMRRTIETKESFFHVAFSICKIFKFDAPHIIESLTELETCTTNLELSMHAKVSGVDEFNTWFAIFETLDANADNKIAFEELKKNFGHQLTTAEDVSIASALGHAIYGTVYHDVTDITEQNFYVFIHELLYGLPGSQRQNSWSDVYDSNELKGRAMLCHVIYDVRRKLTGQHDVMSDCVKSYQVTKDKILGEDGVFAPEIVFTMADGNRDGQISHNEFNAFIGAPSQLYSDIERKHAGKSMKIDEFRSIMPDKIFKSKQIESDVKSKFELTSMTSSELGEAEMLCHAIIASVQKYPSYHPNIAIDHVIPVSSFKGAGEYIDIGSPPSEHTQNSAPITPATEILHVTNHYGEPLEIEIRHPTEHQNTPPVESYKGNGEYIPKIDTGITPPAPSRGTENPNGVIYRMYDNEGNPIEFHISEAQIDDIVHEMSQPIKESTKHNETTPTSQPALSSDENEGGLMNEISKILNKRIQEETDEESQLKKLLENMENGDKSQS